MTADLTTLLTELAHDAPSAEELLTGSRMMARRIQRRRRAVSTATAGAALGAVGLVWRTDLLVADTPDGVAASPAGKPSASTAPSTVPPTQLPDCGGSMGMTPRDIPPANVPVRLLSRGTTLPLKWVQSAEMTSDCVQAPAALVLIDSNSTGLIERAVTVWGPQRTPFDLAGFFLSAPVDVDIRGGRGQIKQHGQLLYATWSDGPERHWHATSSGLRKDELVTLINGLDSRDNLVRAGQAAGFAVESLDQATGDPAKRAEWFVAYGHDDNDYIMIRTERRGGAITSGVSQGDPARWRLRTIRGRRALELVKDSAVVHLVWEEQPGVVVSLSANEAAATSDQLVAFAESLEAVDADDPRIKAKLRSAWGDEDPPTSAPPTTPAG